MTADQSPRQLKKCGHSPAGNQEPRGDLVQMPLGRPFLELTDTFLPKTFCKFIARKLSHEGSASWPGLPSFASTIRVFSHYRFGRGLVAASEVTGYTSALPHLLEEVPPTVVCALRLHCENCSFGSFPSFLPSIYSPFMGPRLEVGPDRACILGFQGSQAKSCSRVI